MDISVSNNKFQHRIDLEEKIEAKDWMPDAYRKTLVIEKHSSAK